ncbi:hypothetical protein R1flu_021795 [Riccia fluitans]|uniref:Small EDRK-rich factor-like N-terminal domain-containing protein n=1 Tax=Riccia fluitans TaxID=41844 RepID=A0ABD1ZR10_9MARC
MNTCGVTTNWDNVEASQQARSAKPGMSCQEGMANQQIGIDESRHVKVATCMENRSKKRNDKEGMQKQEATENQANAGRMASHKRSKT